MERWRRAALVWEPALCKGEEEKQRDQESDETEEREGTGLATLGSPCNQGALELASQRGGTREVAVWQVEVRRQSLWSCCLV